MRVYLVAGVLLCLVLWGLGQYYTPESKTYVYEIFFALVTGFLSGALSPVLIYLISGKTAQETLSSEFSGILNRIYSEYAPQKTYPKSKSLNDEFNKDLSAALAKTTRYTFVGQTGIHVPARVSAREQLHGAFSEVEVILAFPVAESFLAQNYAIHGANIGGAPLKSAILASVLALHEVARSNPNRQIKLYLLREGLGFRFESTDHATFLTESPNGLSPNSYPVSYRVDNKSILARICNNTLTIAKSSALLIRLNQIDETQLIKQLGFHVSQVDRDEGIALAGQLKEIIYG